MRKSKMQASKFAKPPGIEYFGLLFFGALLLARAHLPQVLVFDEIHYIPAAKALATFSDNINWVHPPMAKYIMGAGWYLLTNTLHLVGEPTVFRFVSILFGLWALWGVRAWMLALGYSERLAQIALWLTGFNFLWFVQSKTAMLDIFYVAFALWGVLDVYKSDRNTPTSRFLRGWVYLGLSASCKWAAAPFIAIAFLFSKRSLANRIGGVFVMGLTYFLTFVPLAFLKTNAVRIQDFFSYHMTMLHGFDSIAQANHPYLSHWWEWPTLMRPMWYTFEHNEVTEQCVWAGGNPALYIVAIPALLAIIYFAVVPSKKPDRAARAIAALYWMPLLFWAVAPRKLQMYYYYLAPSFFIAPALVWGHEKLASIRRPALRAELGRTKGWLLLGFTLLCAILFIYFLPIMDARVMPSGRYLTYMWFRSWI